MALNNSLIIMLISLFWFHCSFTAMTLVFKLWHDEFSVNAVLNIDSVEVFSQ